MKKVLIQEADESIRDVLRLALEAESFHFVIVADNEQLLQTIQKVHPCLVVMDFICEDANAILTRSLIKSACPTLPVLALSCNNNISTCFAQLGFEGYITKPFDLDVLFNALNYYVQNPLHISKVSKSPTLPYHL